MIDPHKAIDEILKRRKDYAQAKANRTYLEEFRKSKKAILFNSAPAGTVADRESFAYSHPEYVQILEGLRAAVEREEELRWMMIAAQARIDVWRTEESTKRAEMNLA
jgi:hypothetical protein